MDIIIVIIDVETNIDSIKLSDLIFFSVKSSDPKNTVLFGQINGYCWDNSCTTSDIRGKYVQFNNSQAYFEVNILKCNSSYIYQDKDNVNIKSCYNPVCIPACVNGICINDNVCDCTNTKFKGNLCNEHYPLKRMKILDLIILILSIFLIVFTIILIIGVLLYHKHTIIKAGNFL
ncbi:hypothetical protein PIROE2DRAFT_12460 [Piromyces sp. E2]|nr:hypothetical protein PIROE2DRAFT_12460 [Piromyces sp. E2]|eukprot:OUM61508.1 hypothetical protein PIROE2DRAFT_12460 [Piromyces sp. E2]